MQKRKLHQATRCFVASVSAEVDKTMGILRHDVGEYSVDIHPRSNHSSINMHACRVLACIWPPFGKFQAIVWSQAPEKWAEIVYSNRMKALSVIKRRPSIYYQKYRNSQSYLTFKAGQQHAPHMNGILGRQAELTGNIETHERQGS